jgi:deoxyadenosine/deoxycytidine kinase
MSTIPRKVVFVFGPTAVGKSSLVNGLNFVGKTYVEKAEENPFLGTIESNAISSQKWFLDRIKLFLESNSEESVIVDQHPLGVNAYTKFLMKKGLVTSTEAEEFEAHCLRLLKNVQIGGAKILTATLTARTETLWKRLLSRNPNPTFTKKEVDEINQIFQGIFLVGEVLTFNTDVVDISAETNIVEDWIRKTE